METPYGEIPERFVKDMSAQEMHDYLQQRYSRRRFLKGAAGAGTLAVAGPVFWQRKYADSSAAGSPVGPQWIALGPDPGTEMHVSWSAGAYETAANVPAPVVRWGRTREYGRIVSAASDLVPTPTNAPAQNLDLTAYQHALLTRLEPDTTYHYSSASSGRAPASPSRGWLAWATTTWSRSPTTVSPGRRGGHGQRHARPQVGDGTGAGPRRLVARRDRRSPPGKIVAEP